MDQKLVITGCILGILAIILGAFGAHGLKSLLQPEQLESFETGVKYQMYHAFLFLVVGLTPFVSAGCKNTFFYILLAGVLLFSGSIYLLSTRAITGIDIRPVAFITPVGGLLLIAGWIVLLIDFLKFKG